MLPSLLCTYTLVRQHDKTVVVSELLLILRILIYALLKEYHSHTNSYLDWNWIHSVSRQNQYACQRHESLCTGFSLLDIQEERILPHLLEKWAGPKHEVKKNPSKISSFSWLIPLKIITTDPGFSRGWPGFHHAFLKMGGPPGSFAKCN